MCDLTALRLTSQAVRKSQREIDREMRKMEKEEKKLLADIKKTATAGNTGASRTGPHHVTMASLYHSTNSRVVAALCGSSIPYVLARPHRCCKAFGEAVGADTQRHGVHGSVRSTTLLTVVSHLRKLRGTSSQLGSIGMKSSSPPLPCDNPELWRGWCAGPHRCRPTTSWWTR